MDVLGFATLVVVGFTSCAEFGSYALVYPVIRRLRAEHYLTVEKGLLHTLGRAMPPLFIGSTALAIANASVSGGAGGPALWRWLGAGFLIAALVSTVIVNVPINIATEKWDPQQPPADWKSVRHRWNVFNAVRCWLLLIGFVLICVGFSIH
jgi:hypothetical protein